MHSDPSQSAEPVKDPGAPADGAAATAAQAGPFVHPLRGLLAAQFLNSFNNYAFKAMIGFLAIAAATAAATPPLDVEAITQHQIMIALITFMIPLTLASLPACLLADQVSKRSIIVGCKIAETGLLIAGFFLLAATPAFSPPLLIVLGCLGAVTSLLSPAKYGIIPEVLPHDKLSKGNSLLELWSWLAVITGTGAGGALKDAFPKYPAIGVAILVALGIVGIVTALDVPRVPAARKRTDAGGDTKAPPGTPPNPPLARGGVADGFSETITKAWAAIRGDRILWLAILGQTFFYTVVSLVGQNILVYPKATLGFADAYAALPMVVLAVGIGVGSLLAAKLSSAKVEYGLLPLGSLVITIFLAGFGFGPGPVLTFVLSALLGIGAGLVAVPLNAIPQWRAPADRRGAVIALANVLVFTGTIAGSVAGGIMAAAEINSQGIFVASALATAAGTCWATWLVPDAFLRFLLILLTHTLYRVKVSGRENVPEVGGALLVPNHVSFVDGLFILTSLDRPVRFIVDASYAEHWLFKPFMRALGVISISSSGGPKVILRALKDAGKYLDEGRLVCIFAEGQITRTGMLLPFQRGLERIVKGRIAPIIPMHLDRVWGSIFSREGGRFLRKLPKRLPYPVTVSFGKPMTAGVPVYQVRQAVQDLGESAWLHRKSDRRPLHYGFIRRTRRRPWKLAMADFSRPKVTRLQALSSAIALAKALKPSWAGQPMVGILLPSSVVGALVNIAASLAGKTSVNLNFTAGKAGLESAVGQASLKTVVTSKTVLEKLSIQLPDGLQPIWIDEVAAGISRGDRIKAAATALFAPVRSLEKSCGAERPVAIDDDVTIIFSSGSTGTPKGVRLTHFNIDSNVEATIQVFRVDEDERMLGILPLFHSFGYMSLWLALDSGIGMVFHPSPLDAFMIGELVQRYGVTIALATPTFLQLYMRRCSPAQFGSLRLVLAGAEKLSDRLSTAFEDYFGIRPLEGYGCTECAPVIAVSSQDFRAPGFFQPGSRRGFVGQPLPNVAARIVDPDTFAPVEPNQPGMLLVRGPNVMPGYLGREDLNQAAFRDGWYITGDIAIRDEDGFLKITDRLSRFSKIGGEMVPHGKVEEALHEAAGVSDQSFAVTAVGDEKGERLAVLHTLDEARIAALFEKLPALGLPNLFIPRKDCFVKVEQIPVLGTGKLDLRAIKQQAIERLGAAG